MTLILLYNNTCILTWGTRIFLKQGKTSHKKKILFFSHTKFNIINLINEKFHEFPTKRLKPLYFAIFSYFEIRWEIVCWFSIKHIFFKTAFGFFNSPFHILCMFSIYIVYTNDYIIFTLSTFIYTR